MSCLLCRLYPYSPSCGRTSILHSRYRVSNPCTSTPVYLCNQNPVCTQSQEVQYIYSPRACPGPLCHTSPYSHMFNWPPLFRYYIRLNKYYPNRLHPSHHCMCFPPGMQHHCTLRIVLYTSPCQSHAPRWCCTSLDPDISCNPTCRL